MSRVLLVEDEGPIRELLEMALGEDGHQVRSLVSARGVLDEIAHRRPDIVLLDVMLPGDESGFDILSQVRRVDRDLPIYIMSAHLSMVQTGAKLLGATGFIQKPFELEDVLRLVKEA